MLLYILGFNRARVKAIYGEQSVYFKSVFWLVVEQKGDEAKSVTVTVFLLNSLSTVFCTILKWDSSRNYDMCPAFDGRRWQVPILSPLLPLSQIWLGFFERSLRGKAFA